jgi:twitching motility protein PilT
MVTMNELFNMMREKNASDLHLTAGVPPSLRIDGELVHAIETKLTAEECQKLVYSLMNDAQRHRFEATSELDFAFGIKGFGRLRMNVYRQRGAVGAAIRAIPSKVKTFEDLNLPLIVKDLMKIKKGLVLVTGPTGSGKSTTLASMIAYLNEHYNYHIVTLEDPIEYIYSHKKSVVNQREIGSDTESFSVALRHIVRQDPDVILIGEMRDLETIQAALNMAETGHLVFATLHTSDAIQSINRIIDVFSSHQQEQIRVQLSFVLQAILAQQLIGTVSGKGRALAYEILMATPAVRHLIRERRIELITSSMQTGAKYGMTTMNQCLANLYVQNKISYRDAYARATDVEEFINFVEKSSKKTDKN